VIFALLALLACGPQADPAWLVTKPRILGARTTVDGSERASPAAGERAEIELIVVGTDTPDPLVSWTLAACLAAPTSNGDGFCTGMPFAFDVQTSLGGGPPRLFVDVPAEVPERSTLLVLGAVCVGADLDADLASGEARCVGGDARDPMLVTYRVPIGTGNQNPLIAADAITLGGEPWLETSLITPCADLPQARIGDEMRMIAVDLGGAGREPLEDGPETLVLSHFATARELERQYSVLEPVQDPAATPMEVEWTPELDEDDPPLPADGAVVRFFFVLRDDRSGAAFTTRAICLRP
jgi:hypothetical protein